VRSRTIRITMTALAAALVLSACGDSTDEDAAPDTDAPELEEGDLGEGDLGDEGMSEEELEELGDLEDLLGDQGDLPDPNDQVVDGEFRGQGIILPVPDGFELDPTAFMQGLVAAVTPDGERQIAGQAVDVDTLPDTPDLDELIAANNAQFGEPASDEDVDVDGAAEARQLRYDTLPAQMEGQPDLTLLLVVADNGEGRLAVFNYVAPVDDYDNDEAETALSTVGFDPDSSPEGPAAPAPAPEELEEP
jgi:hypothetical protein